MRRITLFLCAAVAVTSIDAKSYQNFDGTIVDPIQYIYGGNHSFSGNNLQPDADLTEANLTTLQGRCSGMYQSTRLRTCTEPTRFEDESVE